MAMKIEFESKDLASIKTRYAKGEGLKDIAADYEVSPGTIRRLLDASGVDIRLRGRPVGKASTPPPPVRRKKRHLPG